MPREVDVVPHCCPETSDPKNASVFLRLPSEYYYENETNLLPRWVMLKHTSMGNTTVDVKTCPFCGKGLPPIVRVTVPKNRKICVVTDGGYYCDTCSERLIGCNCWSAEHMWGPDD